MTGYCHDELYRMIFVTDFKGDRGAVKDWFHTIVLATTDGVDGSDRPVTTPEKRVQPFLESLIRGTNLNTDGLI